MPAFVIFLSIFALMPVPIRAYSRLLPHTPAHADAQISTGEWQKPKCLYNQWYVHNHTRNKLHVVELYSYVCFPCWDQPCSWSMRWMLLSLGRELITILKVQRSHGDNMRGLPTNWCMFDKYLWLYFVWITMYHNNVSCTCSQQADTLCESIEVNLITRSAHR